MKCSQVETAQDLEWLGCLSPGTLVGQLQLCSVIQEEFVDDTHMLHYNLLRQAVDSTGAEQSLHAGLRCGWSRASLSV